MQKKFVINDVKNGGEKKEVPHKVQNLFVGLAEFESATPCPPDKYANQLRYSPKMYKYIIKGAD